MIRSLRRRHFRVMIFLMLAVPLVFFLGISQRKVMPLTATFPLPLEPLPQTLNWYWQTTENTGPVSVILRTSRQNSSWFLDIQPMSDLAYPDLLIYYSTNQDQLLLEEARLLGSMSGAARRRFELPQTSIGKLGQLRFYSLAHRQLIATLALPSEATTQ